MLSKMEENMKKILLRLVLPILAVATMVCALVGIHSLADSPTPYIYSKNVTYGSYIVMNYAIPVESVPSGQTVGLGIYASASATEPKEIVTDYSIQTVYGKPCYIFQTHGVAAKNINTYEYVRPVTSDGAAHGEIVRYSVEDYLYQRLYTDGYALMDDGDGEDYTRRNLYYDTLWYGASAQQLLLSSQLAAGTVTPVGRDVEYFGSLYFVL